MGHDSEKQSFKPSFKWSKSIFIQEKWDAAMRGKDDPVVLVKHMLVDEWLMLKSCPGSVW